MTSPPKTIASSFGRPASGTNLDADRKRGLGFTRMRASIPTAVAVALLALVAIVHTTSDQAAHAEEFASPTHARTAPLLSRRWTTCCARLLPDQSIEFTGLYPGIEGRLPLANFRPGQIVEIDPRTMSSVEAVEFVAGLKALGARVSIYLVGGHCELGPACDSLPKSVRLGSTGSWHWNKEERRILDITHPAVLARLRDGIENGWRLGANYIRIDNLHHPAGSTHPRTPAQMRTIINMAYDIEDRLRAESIIEPERVTGLVAHNNLTTWEELITQGRVRRPPSFLTSERTAQLAALPGYEGDSRLKRGRLRPIDVPDIQAGRRIAECLQIPYTIVEFDRAHDLTHPEHSYELPRTYIDALRQLSGVTEVIVLSNEDRYVGRDRVFQGPGPNLLPRVPLAQCFPLERRPS